MAHQFICAIIFLLWKNLDKMLHERINWEVNGMFQPNFILPEEQSHSRY